MPLLTLSDAGLYCAAGGFHIDPWKPVARAVVTHAHADHLRGGSERYLVAKTGETVTRARLPDQAIIDTLPYGEQTRHQGVGISFHPAGHVLGSAQVRLEHQGEVWVASGDYRPGGGNPTCESFEPVRCHTFITESTFGLPIYRWKSAEDLTGDLNTWWRANADAGRASIVYAYSLGKAQRLLAMADPSIGPIFTHGAVERLNDAYRAAGVKLPPTQHAGKIEVKRGEKKPWAGSLIVAPPSAHGSTWVRTFAPFSAAIASGWMRIRGTRRRRAVDRGLVLSDHADWPGLLSAIEATGAEQVWVTHGYIAVLVRYLRERGIDAQGVETRFVGEAEAESGDEAPTEPTEAAP
ncbi:MAG: ligase-associated DNA damage response exonuclease [Gemmataceae bacterium]|nr:ligase-associated DNA damage response exonuclease [Gemmataceae bacterium]